MSDQGAGSRVTPAASPLFEPGAIVPPAVVDATPRIRARTRSIAWIEVGRVLAIVAVIAIHVVSPLIARPGHPSSWWVGNIVDSATRWCVPLFVMISGGLLLSSARTAEMAGFYRHRVPRLAVPMAFWIPFYLLFGHAVSNVPPTVTAAVASVAAGRPYYHLYFLFVIAGLTIVAPFLAWAVQRIDHPRLLAFIAIAFALAIVDNAITALLGIGSPNAATRFVPYIAYFLAGYALLSVVPTPARIRLAVAVLIAGIFLTAVGTWILTQPGVLGPGRGLYLYEYHSITTVPVSLAVYQLLVWSGPWIEAHLVGRTRQAVVVIGAASFGIYLFHPVVLVGLARLGISATMTFAPVAIVVTVGLAFAISLLVVLVLQRFAGIRAIV